MSAYFDESFKNKEGSFELLLQILKMMSKNTTHEDCCNFLYDLGCNLATKYRLKRSRTLSELNIEINDIMQTLGFGVVSINDKETFLEISHRELPAVKDKDFKDKFLEFFSVIMCGMFTTYFRQTGAPTGLNCRIESLIEPNEAVFTLKHQF